MAIVGPCLHQRHALVEQVAATLSRLDLVGQTMCQCMLANLAREVVALGVGAGFSPCRNWLMVVQLRLLSRRQGTLRAASEKPWV